MSDLLFFVCSGLVGALLYVLMWARSASEVKSFSSLKYLIIGALAGYAYYFLHTEYDFPNALMAIVAGYFADDFLEALVEKMRAQLTRER